MIKRYDIINYVSELINSQSYLEIGVATGECFNKIKAFKKLGVDPNTKIIADNISRLPSDAFFAANSAVYDLIFIDGSHTHDQSSRDLHNALKCLTKDGVIIMHDANPHNRDYEKPEWCGDVWKTVVGANGDTDLFVVTVNEDHGCAVIMRGKSICDWDSIKKIDFNYSWLESNRQKALNLVSFEEFKVLFKDEYMRMHAQVITENQTPYITPESLEPNMPDAGDNGIATLAALGEAGILPDVQEPEIAINKSNASVTITNVDMSSATAISLMNDQIETEKPALQRSSDKEDAEWVDGLVDRLREPYKKMSDQDLKAEMKKKKLKMAPGRFNKDKTIERLIAA